MVGDRLITIAYALMAVGVILFLWLLIRTAGRIMGKTESLSKFKSRFGGFVDFLLIFLGVFFIFCAQACFWLSANLKYHIPLSGKTELGILETYTRPDWDFKQGFHYVPVRADGCGQTFSFELDGESWYVLTEKTEWPDWIRILGLESAYKVNGIYGGEGEPAVRDLISRNYYELDGGQSGMLAFYNRFGSLMLGMKTNIIESKKRNFIAGRSYTIYADSTGLLLQEMW